MRQKNCCVIFCHFTLLAMPFHNVVSWKYLWNDMRNNTRTRLPNIFTLLWQHLCRKNNYFLVKIVFRNVVRKIQYSNNINFKIFLLIYTRLVTPRIKEMYWTITKKNYQWHVTEETDLIKTQIIQYFYFQNSFKNLQKL